MSEQTEMRECPFCGRHNIGTDYGPYRQWVQCFCHDCGASAASCDSEVLAIAAWNQRSMDAELQRLQDRVHWLEGQNKRLQEILDGWQVENYGDY